MGGGRADEFRAHWRTLAGCTLAAAIGTIGLQAYTNGAFVAALTAAGLYTRTQLSFATFLLSAVVAVAAPFAGIAIDRFGALRIIGWSVVGEAAGFALLGFTPHSLPVFTAAMMLLALLGVGTIPPGFARIVTARFDRGRGLALGVMISGLGIMAMAGPIWANWVIGQAGWRGGYLAVAGVVLLFGGAGTLLIRSEASARSGSARPPASGRAGGDWAALRRPLFWGIVLGFLSASLFGGGYLLHMITLLHERGVSTGSAAKVQSLIGAAVLVGRLASGAALDRFRAQHVAGTAFVISSIGCLLLIPASLGLSCLSALAMGLTIGAELDIMAYMISRHFGLASFARLYGLAYGGLIAAGGLSPLLISKVADAHGYDTALMISAAGLLGGAILLLFLPGAPGSTASNP